MKISFKYSKKQIINWTKSLLVIFLAFARKFSYLDSMKVINHYNNSKIVRF